MLRARSSSFTSRMLVAVALSLVFAAVAAASVKSGGYHGTTNQRVVGARRHIGIAFTVSNGNVSGIHFKINDTCPDGHILVVTVSKPYFPALPIGRKGKFSATVHPPNAATQPTSIRGTISGKTATGAISDTSLSPKEHRLCHGHTGFTAKTK